MIKANIKIFDFDGTLTDSERYSWMAFNMALEPYNVQLTHEDIQDLIGGTSKSINGGIKKKFDLDYDVEEFTRLNKDIFFKLAEENNLQPFEEVIQFINIIQIHKNYIVSSNKKDIIIEFLEKWNLRQYFYYENILSVNDTGISKEEFFNQIQAQHNVGFNEMYLFEDNIRTLALGKKLGMKTVGVEHIYNRGLLEDVDILIRTKVK